MSEDPKQSGCGAQKIGVHDYASLVELLENTFKRLYGRTSDPQDMIQYMEANIMDFRKREVGEDETRA